MKLNFKVIVAIIKKDFHGLLPLVILACVVLAVEPIVAELDLTSEHEFWATLKMNFYWLGYFLATLLMISVIQLDPATSLHHDWLTRPIARLDWLVAKSGFLLLTVYVPIVISRFIVSLNNDYRLTTQIAYALTIENPAGLLAVPLFFAIALLTATLRKSIFLTILVFMLFLIPAWDLTRPMATRFGIGLGTDVDGMMWAQSLPMALVGIVSALGVYWLLYCRRKEFQAYLLFACSTILYFLIVYPPASIYGWNQAIALHEAMINAADSSLENTVALEQAQACFAAAPVTDAATGQTNPLLVQAGLYEEILTAAGPNTVAIATPVRFRTQLVERISPSNTTRDIGIDWLVNRIRVQGHFSADSIPEDVPLIRANRALNRYAPMSSIGTSYWLIPGETVAALAADPSTRLTLDYDLALLSPTSYELKTDGERYHFPELGSCRAEVDAQTNSIEIDCVKQGTQPALVSAELVGVSDSRVDNSFRPAFKPGWLEAISRKEYKLTLDSPNLVDSSVIIVTAYEVERIMHKQLQSSGLLGGPSAICPPTAIDQFAAVEQSNWSDKSPHEISSVAVERGVRVEVLDWRTEESTGKPTLVLLHGLGATAHSYDDLAIKLAENYAVVGISRRGVGNSSTPDYGYDIARLSQDVLQVLDTLNIEHPVLVGHSIGGEELSYLGANYPDRLAGLVYLDAAYDRTRPTNPEYRALNALLPSKPPPRPSEFASYQAANQYSLRTRGVTGNIPEGEIMASYDFDTGAIKHNSLYLDAVMMGLQAPQYERIPIPALGIFAVPSSPASLMERWYDAEDPQTQEVMAELFDLERAGKSEQIKRFREELANSEVLVIDDADHWIFVSHEQEVLNAVDSFVTKLF
ncbi:MAG: alpha/beta hydrolase [Pseudohongiellaceae bacterium]